MPQMDFVLLLAVLSFFSIVVNVIHWRFHANEQFLCMAHSGSIRAIQILLIWMLPVLAVLFLSHLISDTLFPSICFAAAIAGAVFSIWMRHRKRKNRAGQK